MTIGGFGGADLDDADGADYDNEDFYDDSVSFTTFDGIDGTGDDPLIFRTGPCSYSRTC